MRGTTLNLWLGITYLVRKIKFKRLFQGPLAKWVVPHGNQICGSSRGHEHWRKEKDAKEDMKGKDACHTFLLGGSWGKMCSCRDSEPESCDHSACDQLKAFASSCQPDTVNIEERRCPGNQRMRKNIRGMRMMLMLSKRSMRPIEQNLRLRSLAKTVYAKGMGLGFSDAMSFWSFCRGEMNEELQKDNLILKNRLRLMRRRHPQT